MLVLMVGDVLVNRANPGFPFERVHDALDEGDFLFGNCEAAYTPAVTRPPIVPFAIVAAPRNIQGLAYAGFDVMSCANNHFVDGGHEALLRTLELLDEHGIASVGAGSNLAAARRPVVSEVAGVRVATVAFTSVFPFGYEATENAPGVAPLRAWNHWECEFPHHWLPGSLPTVCRTYPHEGDLAALRESLSEARESADVVLASFHWGDHTRPAVVTDHERRTARQAVDFGADIVVGHHQHLLRGCEWYRGKPIFYGLGHFVLDCNIGAYFRAAGLEAPPELDEVASNGSYAFAPRAGWPLLPFHPDARMTVIAWAEMTNSTVERAGVLPCVLTPEGQVLPASPHTNDGKRVVEYIYWLCRSEGLAVEVRLAADRALDGTHAIEFVRTV